MLSSRFATVAIAFTIALPSIGRADESGDHPPGLEVVVSAANGEVPQVTPIEVTIKAVNRSDSAYYTKPDIDPLDRFEVEVSQDGKAVSKTRFAQYREGRSPDHLPGKAHLKLRPSQRLEYKCYPNLVYDMTTPGDYTIRVGLPYADVKTREFVAWSKPIKVKVVKIGKP